MAIATHQDSLDTASFTVRSLAKDDVHQTLEIEKEVFPNLFPPTSFHRELKNPNSHFLVATRNVFTKRKSPIHEVEARQRGILHHFLNVIRRRRSRAVSNPEHIVGFIGTWYMVDEAHIVSIGVRNEYQGQGIGNLLFLGAIDHAIKTGAETITLEVRPSNLKARNLYKKHGLSERGVRKSYYSDDREDAIIMTSEPIQMPEFTRRHQSLKRGGD